MAKGKKNRKTSKRGSSGPAQGRMRTLQRKERILEKKEKGSLERRGKIPGK